MLPRPKSKVDPFKRVVSIFVIVVFFLIASAVYVGVLPTKEPTMPVIHILLLKFKPTTNPEAVQRLSEQVVALKDTCVHPETNKPYIILGKGGINNSPEKHSAGLTHGYILEFKDDEDRDYFLDKDPSHKAFVDAISQESDDYLVLDFTPGVY
ncbi:hypothetical protein V496_05580 [Pseudogymnoascus sp. VKM F-4515 (FW-2607)]|nr:hypothetical protein V496_05580 [Pseudogymnoascus sp. VKM F-4515 (FW-2607)]KFY86166.1 hypothetical protein V498_07585 [Pseudogymnoascus sp. VKM F-4517 (FW-2822)]